MRGVYVNDLTWDVLSLNIPLFGEQDHVRKRVRVSERERETKKESGTSE